MAEIIPTGIPRLDEALIEGKGVALGSSVLIEGTSGAGKELLAKQYAAAGIGSENVVYFSTDETSEELIETFEHYNWPTDMRIVNIGTQYFEKVLAREKAALDAAGGTAGLAATATASRDSASSSCRATTVGAGAAGSV